MHRLHPYPDVQVMFRRLLIATLIGLLAALAVALFRHAMVVLETLFLGNDSGSLVNAAQSLPAWRRLITPALGGLAAGALLWLWQRRSIARPHAATDYMEALETGDGCFDTPASLVKSLASLLVVVTGSAIGREGAMILLAALAARFKRVEEWLAPPVLAMKTVPVASFVILALIWFGSRNLSVFIALVMVFPVIYTNVLAGVRAADRELTEMARVFRIPLLRRIRCIALPQVAPYFRAGCALGLGLCWKAGVAAEVMAVANRSVGGMLYDAKVYLEISDLFAWTVLLVAVSILFEKAFLWLLDLCVNRAIRWEG